MTEPVNHRAEALRLLAQAEGIFANAALCALTHAVLALADETASVAAEINQLFPLVAGDNTPIVTTQQL